MKKGIVFDTGPLISLTLNGSLWILEKLKAKYSGEFYITPAIKWELIDQPLHTKKYKFESVRIMPYLANKTIEIIDNSEIHTKTEELLNLANNTFSAKGQQIKIVHKGEAEGVAACLVLGAKTFVVDERTTRYLIEAPEKIHHRLERKLHQKIHVDKTKLKLLKTMLAEIQPIRSTELMTIAFERDMLTFYEYSNINKDEHFKKTVLEGALWALKLSGCAIQESEINEILKQQKF